MKTLQTGTTDPGASAADQELPPGTEVGEYRIEARIGKGGFGTVYRAIQPVIGNQVAIKVLARRFAGDETIVSRFIAEARAVNQIRHRHIIDIFSFSQLADGRHYCVMECLDGEPLDQYLAARGSLPLDEAVPILRAIGKALDAAHAKGIAHRDLKPENIFLARDPDGATFPKLLDFGIAKLMAPIGRDVCGNGVIEDGEDRDSNDRSCVQCGITGDASGGCPDGFGCSLVDGFCHAPGGEFGDATSPLVVPIDTFRGQRPPEGVHGDPVGRRCGGVRAVLTLAPPPSFAISTHP